MSFENDKRSGKSRRNLRPQARASEADPEYWRQSRCLQVGYADFHILRSRVQQACDHYKAESNHCWYEKNREGGATGSMCSKHHSNHQRTKQGAELIQGFVQPESPSIATFDEGWHRMAEVVRQEIANNMRVGILMPDSTMVSCAYDQLTAAGVPIQKVTARDFLMRISTKSPLKFLQYLAQRACPLIRCWFPALPGSTTHMS
jgi:hypothetical protein